MFLCTSSKGEIMVPQKSGTMTSRERLLGALRREEVDAIPCCMGFNPLDPVLRRGHGWNFPWSASASAEESLTYQVQELGLDQVVHLGADLCLPVDGVESKTWLDGDVLHQTYRTPVGDLHASVRYNDLWPHGEQIPFYSDFNIGHFIEPWIQSEGDLACFQQVRRLSDSNEVLGKARTNVAAAKRLAERYQLATLASVGSGLTGAQHLFGAADLCLMTLDQPDLVEAYLEYEHRINLRTLEVLGDLGIDMVRRNGFYETADFYSPAMLEHFLGARLRREAQTAREAGMHMSYTVHTGVMPILDHLAGLKMDSLFGIDPVFKRVDLATVHSRLASETGLWIGPSSTYHLWQGAEATRQAVRDVFQVFAQPGFVLSPCVSAHSIMPWESTLAMIDEWKKLR
jgi:uroporphyrinogen-III decarboxylase